IAGLTWDMVVEPDGRVASSISVRSSIAKKQSGRRVPVHPELKRALISLRRVSLRRDLLSERPVIVSARGEAMKPNS
ncbi:hypothetical protein, partial [Stenotrophomonas maltophilia]